MILRTCAAAAAVLSLGARVLAIDTAVSSSAGAEFIDVSPHHFAVHRSSADRSGRVMRRQAAEAGLDGTGISMELNADAGAAIKQPTATRAADVAWGKYRFIYVDGTTECVEPGVDTWEGKSFFEAWEGTDTGLTATVGTQVQDGVITETDKVLRIYKAACPNSTAVKVGGIMVVPGGSSSIDIVFGITRKCTGDCAHFMMTLLDYNNGDVVHRWCWNRQGNKTEISCDESLEVPYEKWNRAFLDISNYTDYATPLKLELSVYTSGDFRNLATLPGEVGLGGRAMTLIDSLMFGPAERPDPDSSYVSENGVSCRQSMRDVCGMNSWCLDKYRCLSGYCAEGKARCNSIRNCEDDSDEVGCAYNTGFRAEFYLNHARHLTNNVDVNDLTFPDIRTFIDEVDFDPDDFWNDYHARENFAMKIQGNFSIQTGGHYSFGHSGDTNLKMNIKGRGKDNLDRSWNITATQWLQMTAGDYEMKITYVHRTTGLPTLVVNYTGLDTSGVITKMSKDIISATLTGSHCDTMQCNTGDGLVPKPGYEKLLCASVPCVEAVDTTTCCTREYKEVTAGDHRTCALDLIGRPICWGAWTGYEEQWKNHPGPFVDISTRGQYICAVLAAGGTVDCWKPDNVSAPLVRYSTDGSFTNISVGGSHTCALRDTGAPACTGDSTYSQTNPPSGIEFSELSLGQDFSCGITKAHKTVECWGRNQMGQAKPPENKTLYTSIGAGENHACGISNGSALCWGWNSGGQATPPSGPQDHDFKQVASGTVHSCALRASGEAVCWPPNLPQTNIPLDDAPFVSLTAGKKHTCGIRNKDNEVVCWGSNFETDFEGTETWRGQSEPPPAGIWPYPLSLPPVEVDNTVLEKR